MTTRGILRRRRPGIRACHLVAVATLTSGCGLVFPASSGEPAPSSAVPAPPPPAPSQATGPSASTGTLGLDDEVPPGRGTLRQEEISVTLTRGDLRIRVTPLHESVIRATAPDTYERLSSLGRGHQEVFLERTGSAVPFQLFLVSLDVETTETMFEPEALNVVSRGLRYRPAEVHSLTPEWETRRLRPREPLMAVYAFPGGIDLGQDLEVEYEEVRSREWARVLPVIEAERARVQARR